MPSPAAATPADEPPADGTFSLYSHFSREQWARLRASTPLTLSEQDLERLRGIGEEVSLDEVEEVYLPLARLLNLYVVASQDLFLATETFLGHRVAKVPYVVGLAGSVAVGKSTTARILQELLVRSPRHPRVALVPTDGFLHPNATLEARGLMERKGFPESYDVERLLAFLADLKAGRPRLSAPVYSHLVYDVVPGRTIEIDRPDVVIIEGLNILQPNDARDNSHSRVFVSDFFDFSIYVDAEEAMIRRWYVDRFLTLRDTAFRLETSYFHRYATLSDAEARRLADEIWTRINGENLRRNILPTRPRASLILHKDADHAVREIKLRKL